MSVPFSSPGDSPWQTGGVFAAAVVGIVLLAGCDRRPDLPDTPVVAQVGSLVLTASDVEIELARRRRAGLPSIPPAEVVEGWVRHQVLLIRAREAGLDRDPELQRRMERVLVARLEEPLEERLRTLESVTPDEVEAFHRDHAGEFQIPEQVRVAQIWFRLPSRATPEQREAIQARATAVRAAAVAAGATDQTFGDLARQHSEDRPTRYTGGDCGWVALGGNQAPWPADAEASVFALQRPGEISPVIESEDGFRLFRLTARRPAQPRAVEEVRDQIVHRLQRERRTAAVRQFHESMRAGLAVQVRPEALASIPGAPVAQTPGPVPPPLPAD